MRAVESILFGKLELEYISEDLIAFTCGAYYYHLWS